MNRRKEFRPQPSRLAGISDREERWRKDVLYCFERYTQAFGLNKAEVLNQEIQTYLSRERLSLIPPQE